MRVAVVAQASVVGGAEVYLTRLYGGLAQRGHAVHLFGSLPGWPETGLARTSVHLSPKWSRKSIASGLIGLPGERRAIASKVQMQAPDLVHVQFKREQIGLTGPLSRIAPVVWTEHGRFPTDRWARRALTTAYRAAARRAAGIICVSEAVADDVRGAVGRSVRVEVVENAVDTTRMRPPTPSEKAAARRQLGLASDEGPVLLWIGRLHAGKLPQLAVQAAAYWPGVTVIAGDGAERSRLESTITLSQRADDPVRVTLLGHLEDPSPAYRAADVLLFTSGGGGEGFPTTMLEAAAHGLPLVANEDSGAEKIIAAAGGMVCPADPRALAEGAVSVVEEQRGVLARGWAQEHDISAWLDRHERTFEELAG